MTRVCADFLDELIDLFRVVEIQRSRLDVAVLRECIRRGRELCFVSSDDQDVHAVAQ